MSRRSLHASFLGALAVMLLLGGCTTPAPETKPQLSCVPCTHVEVHMWPTSPEPASGFVYALQVPAHMSFGPGAQLAPSGSPVWALAASTQRFSRGSQTRPVGQSASLPQVGRHAWSASKALKPSVQATSCRAWHLFGENEVAEPPKTQGCTHHACDFADVPISKHAPPTAGHGLAPLPAM